MNVDRVAKDARPPHSEISPEMGDLRPDCGADELKDPTSPVHAAGKSDNLLSQFVRGRRTYEEHGVDACRDIAACFDKEFFSRRFGIAHDTLNPLLLYFSDRRIAGSSPNPLFDEAWYLEANPDVGRSVAQGLTYSGFTHFIVDGLREGRAPNPTISLALSETVSGPSIDRSDFAPDDYLGRYRLAQIFVTKFPILDAYDFYDLFGKRLGCLPPQPQPRAEPFDVILQDNFDPAYYADKYLPAGTSAADALAHYLDVGASSGFNPSPAFDEGWYRSFYSDVRSAIEAGAVKSGFHHYAASGKHEKRRPLHNLTYALEARMAGVTEPRLVQRAVDIAQRVRAPSHVIVADGPARVWFCLPTLNPDISFGGFKAVFELIKAVARTGRSIGVFVTDDGVQGIDYFVCRSGDAELVAAISEAVYVNRKSDEVMKLSISDLFVVYSVWDGYVVQGMLDDLQTKRFLLLAQEFEPIFYEGGSTRALTEAAYNLDHLPLFNSRFLTSYFRHHGIGVFGRMSGARETRDFYVFDHVLTRLSIQPLSELKTTRTLAFYARPEMHAARNLFEFGYLALRRLCGEGFFDRRWRFVGLGGLSENHVLPLGGGHVLEMIQKLPVESYEIFMNEIDVGLSLMLAPHPSVVPFEFAATGAIVVTNIYENRSAEELEAICRNIVPCRPTLEGVVSALRTAVLRAEDVDAREAQRLILPSTSWADQFTPAMLDGLFSSLVEDSVT